MKFLNTFKNFDIDIKSVFFTLIIIPFFLVVRKLVIKYVKEWGEYFVDGIMYILSKYIRQSVASAFSLRRYCKLQLANEGIRFLNIPSTRDLSLDIDKIFVNLTISYNDEAENDFSHFDFLSIGNRVKVMGDPGSGKTSLIKRVFRNNCQEGLKKPRKAKLPILIELKNIAPPAKVKDFGKWFYNYIKAEVSKNKVYKIDECFENYSVGKGLLVLLDGLDEVSSANYSKISDCINGLSRYLNELGENNSVVLTMRTQFYQQIKSDFSVSFPHNTFLKPFSPSDIYEFLSRWHFEKDGEKHISRVYRDLTDKPTLREMCSNPLILSMYVAEDQISKGSITPESRTQFYKKITEELVIKRRLRQKTNIPGSYSALKEQRERILGSIAYEHLTDITQSSNSLKYKNAIKIIRNILACENDKAEQVFNEIAKETGLISEERHKETFRFIHLTFCEFLAAFEASQGIATGWSQLLKFHKTFYKTSEGKSRLIEVIPFVAGLLPRIQRDQALNDVSKLEDLTLMARCFLETKLYRHKTWPEFITESKQNLLMNGHTKLDEKWLQDLHLFNVVVSDANLSAESLNSAQTIDLNEFYENLLDNEKVSLSQILSSFAAQDAAAVFRLAEMSRIDLRRDFPNIIIHNADQVPFLALIKEKMLTDRGAGIDDYASLLVEAALEKKLVSKLMHDMVFDQSIEKRILNGGYRVWYARSIIKKSFLTQCITLSSKNQQERPNLKRVELFSQLKAPAELNFKFLTNSSFFLIFTILVLLYFASTFYLIFSNNMQDNLNWYQTIILPFFYILFILIGLYKFDVIHRYRKAMNLEQNIEISNSILSLNEFILKITHLNFAPKKDREILKELIKLRGQG